MKSTRAETPSIGQLPPMNCLLAFEAVARNQSLGKAVSELGLTKSALTHSINTLEHRLRLRLVQRYSPLLTLTAAGHDYFAATQHFVRSLRDELYLQSPSAVTQLRVSASRGMARAWLGPRLHRFLRDHPRIELILTVADRLEPVVGGGVDVGLRYGGEILPGMVSVPLWQDRLVAVGNRDLARQARSMSLSRMVAELPLIEHPSIGWRHWAQGELPASQAIRPRLETVDIHFALEAALAGNGLAILHRRLVQPMLQDGRLEVVSTHHMPAKLYHAVVSEEQLDRPPMQVFLRWLQEQVRLDTPTH